MDTLSLGRQQRPLSAVPAILRAVLLGTLVLQLVWHRLQPPPAAHAAALPAPTPVATLRLASLGEPVALAKALNLWLQAFDSQPGVSVPFRELDYARLRDWLEHIVELDPRGQYPLLAAARLYGAVPDPDKQRQMLEFVYEKFMQAPNERWPWLAHAALVAKYRLRDLPLALKYARAIADKATDKQVPHWAQQLVVFVLEDMDEAPAARALIGSLLHSGRITDPHELRFLGDRLDALGDGVTGAQPSATHETFKE